MKALVGILVTIGLLLLFAAGFAKVVGRPHITMGVKLITLIILANTAFLLAILTKLCEKK